MPFSSFDSTGGALPEAGPAAWQRELAQAQAVVATPVPAAWLLAQRQWPHVQVKLHRKPSLSEPIIMGPALHTRLIVQLTGALRVGITRHGHRRSHQAQPGSVYLSPPHEAYALDWQGRPGAFVESLELDLDNALLYQTAAAVGLPPAGFVLPPGPCLNAPVLERVAASLLHLPATHDPAGLLYAEAAAYLLATELVRQVSHPPALPAGPHGLGTGRLRLVQDYVRDSLGQPLTLASLAAVACLSPYHFARLFRQATGLSPNQYVTGQRLERARHLLAHTDHPIGQVAQAVGYRHLGHFARLFQQHTGLLPTQVRQAR